MEKWTIFRIYKLYQMVGAYRGTQIWNGAVIFGGRMDHRLTEGSPPEGFVAWFRRMSEAQEWQELQNILRIHFL
jgi:hypothetical protein